MSVYVLTLKIFSKFLYNVSVGLFLGCILYFRRVVFVLYGKFG